jgi:hypothetical protein
MIKANRLPEGVGPRRHIKFLTSKLSWKRLALPTPNVALTIPMTSLVL